MLNAMNSHHVQEAKYVKMANVNVLQPSHIKIKKGSA